MLQCIRLEKVLYWGEEVTIPREILLRSVSFNLGCQMGVLFHWRRSERCVCLCHRHFFLAGIKSLTYLNIIIPRVDSNKSMRDDWFLGTNKSSETENVVLVCVNRVSTAAAAATWCYIIIAKREKMQFNWLTFQLELLSSGDDEWCNKPIIFQSFNSRQVPQFSLWRKEKEKRKTKRFVLSSTRMEFD